MTQFTVEDAKTAIKELLKKEGSVIVNMDQARFELQKKIDAIVDQINTTPIN